MTNDDLPDDPQLRALLRTHAAEPPVDSIDWNALHTRTTASAAALLRRRTQSWWRVLGSNSALAARMAAAAAAAVVATAMLMPERPATGDVAEFRTIEEELTGAVPYASVPLLAQDAGNGAVIDALLLYDEEEW